MATEKKDHPWRRFGKGIKHQMGGGFGPKPKPVVATHATTGERREFESQSQAATVLGVAVSHIYQLLRGRGKTAKGWTFTFKNDSLDGI